MVWQHHHQLTTTYLPNTRSTQEAARKLRRTVTSHQWWLVYAATAFLTGRRVAPRLDWISHACNVYTLHYHCRLTIS